MKIPEFINCHIDCLSTRWLRPISRCKHFKILNWQCKHFTEVTSNWQANGLPHWSFTDSKNAVTTRESACLPVSLFVASQSTRRPRDEVLDKVQWKIPISSVFSSDESSVSQQLSVRPVLSTKFSGLQWISHSVNLHLQWLTVKEDSNLLLRSQQLICEFAARQLRNQCGTMMQ